jgi:hypothetical protein
MPNPPRALLHDSSIFNAERGQTGEAALKTPLPLLSGGTDNFVIRVPQTQEDPRDLFHPACGSQ